MTTINASVALSLLDAIQEELDRLRDLIQPKSQAVDPSDPKYKLPDGKLTPLGTEVLYGYFDEEKSIYAAAKAMKISYGAAKHRFQNWEATGGKHRRSRRTSSSA